MWQFTNMTEWLRRTKAYWQTLIASIKSYYAGTDKLSASRQTILLLWNESKPYRKSVLMLLIGLALGCLMGCGKSSVVIKKVKPPEVLLQPNQIELIEPKTNGELLDLFLKVNGALQECNSDKLSIKSFYLDHQE